MPTDTPALKVGPPPVEVVHRVGYGPDPWRWTPWHFGPFTGRWDDPDDTYRVVYAGASAYACYLEVLARFREDPTVTAGMGAIAGDAQDGAYPTIGPGVVPASWFGPRLLACAVLAGNYVDVQHVDSIASLRPPFLGLALSLGFPDLDGAAIRSSEPRLLTQRVSRALYLDSNHRPDGVLFESRHGNDLALFAIFERPETSDDAERRSRHLAVSTPTPIDADSADFKAALNTFGLVVH